MALKGVDRVPSTVLLDLRPAGGGHGQRGIGRYVRGLGACVVALPPELARRVWVMGPPGPLLAPFSGRTVSSPERGLAGRLPHWIDSPIRVPRAIRTSGAIAWHATDPQRPYAPSHVRAIVTVYDLIPLREPALLETWRRDHRVTYRRYVDQIARAERVVAISRTTAADLEERLGIAADRIDVVYPVVVRPAAVDQTSPPEPTFLAVGALDAHKQPELVLAALAGFRSRHHAGRLRLIGPSDPAAVDRLSRLAAQLGVADAVAFEGRIPDAALDEAYAGATALVAASRIEGFGLPAIEAVLRGVPVIAVDTAIARETLHGVATLVPADRGALAEAMASPAPPTPEAIDRTARRFSPDAAAAALAVTYRRVLD